MKNVKVALILLWGTIFVMSGCASDGEFTAVERVCRGDVDKAGAMRAAEEVLGEMQFRIEKSDEESGYIRSRPLIGGQFFELWRSDNVGGFNWSEANLHSIRRVVEVEVREQGGQSCVVCSANVQRLVLPEREVDSSAKAYAMFSDSGRRMQRLEISPEQRGGMAWMDLGRDRQLETLILERIEKLRTK